MKALLTLKSAINQSTLIGLVALIGLIPALMPHLALASQLQTEDQKAKFFEIKIEDSIVLNSSLKSNTEQKLLTMDTLAENDPLVIKLTAYLEKHNSPLAEHSAGIVQQPQWQRALAISWVESNFGRFCHSNNCSGIGGAPGMKSWRKYSDKFEWFKDMCVLLETPRYKERFVTFRQMKGVYVQPGTENWVNGAQKKYNELMAITDQAEEERRANSEQHLKDVLALATFSDSSN